MSYIDTSVEISEDNNVSQHADDELDFNSPMFHLACKNNGFKPEDLMKKSLQEIREIHRAKQYSEEGYFMLANHYEQRRRQKVKIVIKERNYLIEERIAELHPALHYKGKTVVYALGASINRYKEPKARRELREMIHRQEADLIELLLQEKEFGRDGYAKMRAAERQRNGFGLNFYPRPAREIEYIEAEEIRKLRTPKKQTRTEREAAKEAFEREFGMSCGSSAGTRKASSGQKSKKFHNKIVSVPGNLLETKLVTRPVSATPNQMMISAATKFARMTLDTEQQLVNERRFNPKTAINGHKPVIMDRNKEKKILFEKGRALASAFTTPQNSAQKEKIKATDSAFKTPKKGSQRNVNAKTNSAAAKMQTALFEHLQESQINAVNKYADYDNESTDDDWEHKLASTFTPGQRWIDINRVEDPNQYMRTPETKAQAKMSTSSNSFYKNQQSTPQRHGQSVQPKQRNQNRGVGQFAQEPRYTVDMTTLNDQHGRVSQFEEDFYNQAELKRTPIRKSAEGGKSKCLGMVYPSSMMSTPVDKKFMDSTFKSNKTASTKMFDGASNSRSDGFRGTLLSF